MPAESVFKSVFRTRVSGSVGIAMLVVTLGSCSTSAGAPTGSAATATSNTASGTAFKVRSSLDGHTQLPHRIQWVAYPSGAETVEVDYLVDGKQLWVEHTSPYFYGDDGNYFVTSFLTPGRHTFTVRAVDSGGQFVNDTVTATVPAAARPPGALAGRWKKFFRQPAANTCTPGPCPPAGYWRLVITSVGWQVYDTGGGGGLYDVIYPSPGIAEIRTGMATGHQKTDGNAFCNDSPGDRPAGRTPVKVRWAIHGALLSFAPVGSQTSSCGFTDFLTYNSSRRPAPWARAGA